MQSICLILRKVNAFIFTKYKITEPEGRHNAQRAGRNKATERRTGTPKHSGECAPPFRFERIRNDDHARYCGRSGVFSWADVSLFYWQRRTGHDALSESGRGTRELRKQPSLCLI